MFEQIIFLETDGVNAQLAKKAFGILNYTSPDAAIKFLSDWHYPGEHPTGERGAGRSDAVYERNGYVLSWNQALGYISLAYRITE